MGLAAQARERPVTASAWALLGLTWSVIVFFTARFFWKVATLPSRGRDDAEVAPPPGSGR